MDLSKLTSRRHVLVLVVAAILLELTTAVQFMVSRQNSRALLKDVATYAMGDVNHASKLKVDVEDLLHQYLPDFERYAENHQTDSAHTLILQVLEEHQRLNGIDFCYVVNDKAKREGFVIFRDEDDNIFAQDIDFDYTTRSWYQIGIQDEGGWSEPYEGKYSDLLMCTFAHPLYDSNDKLIAVLGFDVPLEVISSFASAYVDNQQRILLPLLLVHLLGLLVLFYILQHSIRSTKRLQDARIERERIDNELTIAREIQTAMLPKTLRPYSDRKDFDVFASLTPAREVGGDFYDYMLRDEKLFFCIGDVSGKGVPAALVMSTMQSALHVLIVRESAPDRIVSQLNEALARDNEHNLFVTLFLGVLDLPTGRLRYTSAGHPAPYLGTEPLPVDRNLPVGAMPDWRYTVQETILTPQSAIFLFTDGLNEAENAAHELFGKSRIVEHMVSTDPRQLVEGMVAAVHSFVNGTEQSDDMTMMAIHYNYQKLDIQLHRELTLPNDVNQTPVLGDFVEEVCEAVGFDMSTTKMINLAIEEAVVNVMCYAYPRGTEGTVEILAESNSERLKFVITDSGKPFDPTTHDEVDITLDAEDRDIGGLGIHLMRRCMDSINYERVNNKNILTLRKKLNIEDSNKN